MMVSGRNPQKAKAAEKRFIDSARTGSAPLVATDQDERSSVARSSSVTFRVHRSNAKLGAADRVPRYFEIARSHRTGFCRNATVGIETEWIPSIAGATIIEISPMS